MQRIHYEQKTMIHLCSSEKNDSTLFFPKKCDSPNSASTAWKIVKFYKKNIKLI